MEKDTRDECKVTFFFTLMKLLLVLETQADTFKGMQHACFFVLFFVLATNCCLYIYMTSHFIWGKKTGVLFLRQQNGKLLNNVSQMMCEG